MVSNDNNISYKLPSCYLLDIEEQTVQSYNVQVNIPSISKKGVTTTYEVFSQPTITKCTCVVAQVFLFILLFSTLAIISHLLLLWKIKNKPYSLSNQ